MDERLATKIVVIVGERLHNTVTMTAVAEHHVNTATGQTTMTPQPFYLNDSDAGEFSQSRMSCGLLAGRGRNGHAAAKGQSNTH